MDIPDDVKQLARAGPNKKIHAIQALRRVTGLGLAEAKEIVETIAAGGEVQLATAAPTAPSNETREERLKRQLEAFGRAGRTGALNNEEIGRKLLEILQADEDMLDLAKGTYDNSSGMLVATQRRLLFMSEEMSFGPNVDRLFEALGFTPAFGNVEATPVMAIKEEFALNSIYLVYHRKGLHESSIKIFMTGHNRAEFTNMEKDVAQLFAKGLMARSVVFRTDELGQLGPEDHLEQIEAMYDIGAVTTEELADYKRKILKQIRKQAPRNPEVKRRPS